MTRDEILNLPAGRELDALVAEKVMGWERGNISINLSGGGVPVWKTGKGKNFKVHANIPDWSPSTDIAAAWMVVEKMGESQPLTLMAFLEDDPKRWAAGWKWEARFRGVDVISVAAETAPLAICRAALLAVMEDE